MNRFRAYYPKDDFPASAGDNVWSGVNERLSGTPEAIPPGYCARAINLRFRNGKPVERGGVVLQKWALRIVTANGKSRVVPWSRIDAIAEFKDPNGITWLIFVADGAIWRSRPNNEAIRMDMPAGVDLRPPVSLCQAYGKMFLFRGTHCSTLWLTNVDGAWSDLWPFWKAGSYAVGDTVIWGAWSTIPAGGVTRSGTTVTVRQLVPHNLVDGVDVVMRGAAETEYNVRAAVRVIDELAFSFEIAAAPATPATGTIQWSAMREAWKAVAVTTTEPGTGADWSRDYTVLPNGIDGRYINNRLVFPTAWVPGSDATIPGAYGTKADFLACSSVADNRRMFISNEFRINQGDSDQLLGAIKVSPATLMVYKSGSVGQLWSFTGDLSSVRLEMFKGQYGPVNSRAIVDTGRDLVFVAEKRGVVSMQLTALGEQQGVDLPLSNDIEPTIRRINWNHGDKVRLGYWNNRLYVAVPLDGARCDLPSIDFSKGSMVYAGGACDGYGLTIGAIYQITVGPLQSFRCGPFLVTNDDPTSGVVDHFVAQSNRWTATTRGGEREGMAPQIGLSGTLEGVNNAVLVYDYETQAWSGIDQGPGLAVREWITMRAWGRERLFAVMETGFLAAYDHAADAQDDGYDPTASAGVRHHPIRTEMLSRGYSADDGEQRPKWLRASFATRAPLGEVVLVSSEAKNDVVLATVQRSNRRWKSPVTRPPFDPHAVDAANLDLPNREDYQLDYDPAGFASQSLVGDRLQEFPERWRIPPNRGRFHQLLVSNFQGVFRPQAIALEIQPGARASGAPTK